MVHVTTALVHKLESRNSYLSKAPYQRRSRTRALRDTAMKLSPTSWIGPIILKIHARSEYKKDKKETEHLHEEYEERRESGKPMSTNAVVALNTTLAPIESTAVAMEAGMTPVESVIPGRKTDSDPWKLPPTAELEKGL